MEDTECFEIDEIDVDKIRVSSKKLYNKEHNSYKYYVFYEDEDGYIPMKIILSDAAGYYNDYKDNSKYDLKCNTKRINFSLNNDSMDKIYDIFNYFEEKLNIDFNDFTYESKGEEYLKTIVSDKTLFKKDNITRIILNEKIKYRCNRILQMQSVYYNMKDKHIKHYPQVLL